jgi:ADP-ribose pyrophosphatase YjhB (NUDIX family)
MHVKHSIAVLIRNGTDILTARRSDEDDELPGIWGLPAGTLGEDETVQELITRIGRDKLGVELSPLKRLATGFQDRPAYRLSMELWEVSMNGIPNHPEWKWASVGTLRAGAESGSLCCELALK